MVLATRRKPKIISSIRFLEKDCEITIALLGHNGCPVEDIFGDLDAMKVKSCMTLFDVICPDDIFAEVLNKFYANKRCDLTIRMLSEM